MNKFPNSKNRKKLTLMGATAGLLIGMSYYTKKLPVSLLGSYAVGVLIRLGYEMGVKEALEGVTNDLNDIIENASEKLESEKLETE